VALSTDQVAHVILATIAAEQNRRSTDFRGRRTLGILTKDIMARHHWAELEFLQGWGLLQSEKLVEVQERDGAYYPMVTEAGREFMEAKQDVINRAANRAPLLSGDHLAFVIKLLVIAAIMAYMFWKANH
jgi:hypothetical protein